MKRTVSATQARIHFGELMRRVVESQEPIIVERGGKPHGGVSSGPPTGGWPRRCRRLCRGCTWWSEGHCRP
jgi:prevent-host-death family protein